MNKKGVWGWIGLIFVIVLCCIYPVIYAFSSGEEIITIQEKWVKYHNEDAKYLVSSMAGEVYQITDTLIYFRFNSSDLYAKLQPGMKCKIKYQGFRCPFLSDYKNIISAGCSS